MKPATLPTLQHRGFRSSIRLGAALAALVWTGLAGAQVLEIAADGSPAGLDPHVVPAFNTVLINKNIYEGLTAIDKDLKIDKPRIEVQTELPLHTQARCKVSQRQAAGCG